MAPEPIVSPGPGTLAFDTTPAPSLTEASPDTSSFGLGSDGRAPKRTLNLSFSGQYEQVSSRRCRLGAAVRVVTVAGSFPMRTRR